MKGCVGYKVQKRTWEKESEHERGARGKQEQLEIMGEASKDRKQVTTVRNSAHQRTNKAKILKSFRGVYALSTVT